MHAKQFFAEVSKVAQSIDLEAIETLAKELVAVRQRSGRLFLLGVGGRAADCSQAVSDFRKLCGIEAYTPVDNVSEHLPGDAVGCHIITATNDILKKLSLVGKDLDRYSLETVEMFYKDAKAAGYRITTPPVA